MSKTQPLCTDVELNLETEFWMKLKRTALLLCQAMGDTQLMPPKLCIPFWEYLMKSFIIVLQGQGC